MKSCSQCKLVKPLDQFYQDKRASDGKTSECSECNKAYKRSPEGLVKVMYNTQKRSSNHRKHIPPQYSYKELYLWVISQPNFNKLFMNWVNSSYSKMLVPSCDRLNDYLPYSLDNLRLVTWQENKDKFHKDQIDGINNKCNKAVIQRSLDGKFINEFYSVQAAARSLNKSHGAIACCCRKAIVKKKRKDGRIDLIPVLSAYGYKWEYKLQ